MILILYHMCTCVLVCEFMHVSVCECVCVRERDSILAKSLCVCACVVCMCVRKKDRDRDRDGETETVFWLRQRQDDVSLAGGIQPTPLQRSFVSSGQLSLLPLKIFQELLLLSLLFSDKIEIETLQSVQRLKIKGFWDHLLPVHITGVNSTFLAVVSRNAAFLCEHVTYPHHSFFRYMELHCSVSFHFLFHIF